MNILVLIPSSRYTANVPRDLVYGCWCKGKRIGGIRFPPLPQIQVATVLKKTGYSVDVIDTSVHPAGMPRVDRVIKKYDFLIILTSTMSVKEDAQHLAHFKKINPNLKTIVFGAHPTFMPQQTLSLDGVDFIIRREPELIIKEFIEAYSRGDGAWRNVKGIGWKEGSTFHINEFHPFIENLDDIPIADRNFLPKKMDYFNPVVKRVPYTTMITSKGCPGRCIFCSSPPFYGKKYRLQSAERVLDEMEFLRNKGYKEIFFRDETFTASRQRVEKICDGIIRKNIDITWICSARIATLDYKIMKLMKRAGCHMVRVGVETGVQQLLDNIKKDISLEQIKQTFHWAHKVGIDTHAHCMLGIPGESWETIEATIKFVKKIDPTIVTFGICTPYPGAPLFEMVKKNHPEIRDGTQSNLSKLHTKAFFNQYFTNLSAGLLQRSVHRAYRKFYLRPIYFLKWLPRIKNLDELRRVIMAATQVFQFIGGSD